MSPRFEKIPCTTDINLVRRLELVLLKRLPDSVHIFVLLKLLNEQRFPNELDTQMYLYRNDEDDIEALDKNDNLFIVCIERPNFHSKKGIILLPPRNPTPTHINTFDEFIGWNEPQVFQCTPPSIWNAIQNLCISHGKPIPEHGEGIPGILFAITDMEKGRNLEVKDLSKNNPSFVVRPLEKLDTSTVIKQWKWAASHSEEVVRLCIGTLPSVGVFENGEMASSVLMSPLGVFNALYTSENFRNRGLGQFVMRWISKESARQLGVLPIAEIEVWNEPSKKTLTNAGYDIMFYTKWFYS